MFFNLFFCFIFYVIDPSRKLCDLKCCCCCCLSAVLLVSVVVVACVDCVVVVVVCHAVYAG